MNRKKLRRIIGIVFGIIIFLTVIFPVVYWGHSYLTEPVYEDSKFDFGIIFVGILTIPVVTAEADICYNLRYFLRDSDDKSKGKTVINAVFCIASVGFIVFFPKLFLEYNLETIWIWFLCYFAFRIMYYAVGKGKKNEEQTCT